MLEKQKADLRKEIRGQLRLLPEEEKEILDRQIAERVLTLPAVTDAGAVYGYASLNWETGTAEILKELWKKKCIVCLPRVMGETMEFFVTDSEDDLTEGAFHIMEPKNGCRSAEEYCIAAHPGLRAVGIEYPHAEIGLVRRTDKYQTVTSNSRMRCTPCPRKFFRMADRILGRIYINVVVSGTVHLGEFYSACHFVLYQLVNISFCFISMQIYDVLFYN